MWLRKLNINAVQIAQIHFYFLDLQAAILPLSAFGNKRPAYLKPNWERKSKF